ncbi:hypothetical protein K493DRAFT_338384 [Basidiobolus meristosporus CBS 931.73]|uniref:Uncharacterized protein n=1 Tax=Basidiobolus meristosporus CBS 931.73 TaxID=1314790 RepID=A0A1Y1Y5I2_9FUNG|nr:hypothetical protein K493DRAFT_338384 [Basidiobolus meristosporus CBS 931.73]|eukprot:ORX93253.1 hypothetical protein K493DRAFT_338384 [Basidiobolus meristosporus CBS 931.73]
MLKLTSFPGEAQSSLAVRTRSFNVLDDQSTLIDLVNSAGEYSFPILIFSQPASFPSSDNSRHFKSNEQELLVPMPLNFYTKTQSVVNVYQLNDNRMLLIVANYTTGSTEIYLEAISQLNSALLNHQPALVLKGLYGLTAIDQTKFLLALYNVDNAELHTVSLMQSNRSTRLMECQLDMSSIIQFRPSSIWRILFLLGTYDLCFVESESSHFTYNLRTGKVTSRGRSSKRNSFGSLSMSTASIETTPSISETDSLRST